MFFCWFSGGFDGVAFVDACGVFFLEAGCEALNSRLRRYLNAVDLGDMEYFYSWWGHSDSRHGRRSSSDELMWKIRLLELRRNGFL